MIEVRLEFSTLEEMRAFFNAPLADSNDTSDATTDAPKKRGRKSTKAAETTEAAPAAGAAAADPLAGILGNQQPVMQAPVAAALAPQAQVQTAPAEQPKPVEFKDLIAKFTELGKTKGRDAIAAVLAEFGAKAVPDIPQDQWAQAVARVNQALAA